MAYLAATATTADRTLLWLIVVGVLVAWAAGYVLTCYVWPFKSCRRCTGSGKRRSPSGRAWRKCPRCKGGGERLRFGRRAWNFYRRFHRDAG